MIYLIGAILFLTFTIYYILNDICKTLRINSIITIISGYIIILINIIFNVILIKKITNININNFINNIRNMGVNRGLILILIGTIQFIIYTLIRIYKYDAT